MTALLRRQPCTDLSAPARRPFPEGFIARQAVWIRADSHAALVEHLTALGGQIFPAHRGLLADLLSA